MKAWVDWDWVQEWYGRIFFPVLLLATFVLLALTPGSRENLVAVMPQVVTYAFLIAAAVTLAAAAVLAVISARRQDVNRCRHHRSRPERAARCRR